MNGKISMTYPTAWKSRRKFSIPVNCSLKYLGLRRRWNYKILPLHTWHKGCRILRFFQLIGFLTSPFWITAKKSDSVFNSVLLVFNCRNVTMKQATNYYAKYNKYIRRSMCTKSWLMTLMTVSGERTTANYLAEA
jgi:hypothetical protein